MVKLQQFLKSIRLIYNKKLGKNICLLIVGGSIGRENYIENWSDADLLLVLKKTDSKSLQLVKECEEHLKKLFNIEIDIMITSKFTIEHTTPMKLHDKIKNFLFFLPKEKILIKRQVGLPRINYKKFKYGFWAIYAEQEKNFFRRNTNINLKNKQVLQALIKKNIKIIFLIIRRYLSISTSVPSTYEEIVFLRKKNLPIYFIKNLQQYENMRINNQISTMSITQLRKELFKSVDMFNKLGKLIMKRNYLL